MYFIIQGPPGDDGANGEDGIKGEQVRHHTYTL